MSNMRERIAKFFGREVEQKPLPQNVVRHSGLDRLIFHNYADDSVRFKKMVDDAPRIAPEIEEPQEIDFTTASQDEISKWQMAVHEARDARSKARPYEFWRTLVEDTFFSYHTASEPKLVENPDPVVAHHERIMSRIINSQDFHKARGVTRDNKTLAAMATRATGENLREALETELIEQARYAEELQKKRDEVDDLQQDIEDLQEEIGDQPGGATPEQKQSLEKLQDAQAEAQEAFVVQAENPAPPLSKKAVEAIQGAVKAGRQTAQDAADVPGIGEGIGPGKGEAHKDPEKSMEIAERWVTDSKLRDISQKFGRMKADMRYKRARRIEGGAEEIVDIEIGDDLKRLVPSELALLTDPTLELEFFNKYLSGELLCYQKVGEAHAGRGPIGIVADGSGSMQGDNNTWTRALMLALLDISRREKRDFFAVEFSSANEVMDWEFLTKRPIDAESVLEMCSHFFGGGTTPIIGVQRAVEIMDSKPEFKKADIVVLSDGEASFGPEDEKLRRYLEERGVRIHGIGIGGSFRYLEKMCTDGVIPVHSLELEGANEATNQLATTIS